MIDPASMPQPNSDEFERLFARIYDDLLKIGSAIRRKYQLANSSASIVHGSVAGADFTGLANEKHLKMRLRKRMIWLALNNLPERDAAALHVDLDDPGNELPWSKDEIAQMDHAIDKRMLLAELRRLDSRQAEVFERHHFNGATFEQVAEDMGVSVTTAKTEWKLAKAFIRQHLEGWAAED